MDKEYRLDYAYCERYSTLGLIKCCERNSSDEMVCKHFQLENLSSAFLAELKEIVTEDPLIASKK